jgi:hypothetical protein
MVEEFVPVNHYHDEAMDICNLYSNKDTGEVKTIEQEELEGYYGISVLLSYLKGVEPSVYELAQHLGVNTDLLEVPIARLRVNGLLGNKLGLKKDKVLKGYHHRFSNKLITKDHFTRISWCYVAGVAGGYTGLRN